MVGQRDLAPHPPVVGCQSLWGSVLFRRHPGFRRRRHTTPTAQGFRSTSPTWWSAADNHAAYLSRMTLQATHSRYSGRDIKLIVFPPFSLFLSGSAFHSVIHNHTGTTQSFEHNQKNYIPFSQRQSLRHSQSFQAVHRHTAVQHSLPTTSTRAAASMSYRYGYCYTCHRYVPVYTRRRHRDRVDCCNVCRRRHYHRRYRYHSSYTYRRYPFGWRYPTRDRFSILPVYD
jgi:RNA polymerase-binding transcription factor DksA